MAWALQGTVAPGRGGLEGLGRFLAPRGLNRSGETLLSLDGGQRPQAAASGPCGGLRSTYPHPSARPFSLDLDQRASWKVMMPCKRTCAESECWRR